MVAERVGFYSWPRPNSQWPSDVAGGSVRILDSLKNACVFLGKETAAGNIHWGGTGFFVGIPLESDPDVCARYLVTAGHVADQLESGKFFVRVNKTGGGTAELEFPTTGIYQADKQKWYRHPSKFTDVAVYPCSPNPSLFDFMSIPIGQFLNDKITQEYQIGIGDETVMIGLFSKHKGDTKNIPILRLGNLCMFPDESIARVKGAGGAVDSMNAYLVEVRSTGGLSGSPVFVKRTVVLTLPDQQGRPQKMQGEGEIHLLGLAQGHWEIDPKDRNNIFIRSGTEESINLGIALVVPAYVIREVLEQDELAALRSERDKNWQRRKGTSTPDGDLFPTTHP